MADEEDIVDPNIEIREKCEQGVCKAFKQAMDECTARVEAKPGSENCQEELYNLLRCVDDAVRNFSLLIYSILIQLCIFIQRLIHFFLFLKSAGPLFAKLK